MTTIGIVGAGVAGLHLALYLQKQGVPVTLYSDRSPDEMRAGRLPTTTSFMGSTRARDAALGTNHWDDPAHNTTTLRVQVAGDPPLVFSGTFVPPVMFIDMRLYLPRALEDFAARGGNVVVGPCSAADVGRLAQDHALMVVAAGRSGLTEMFPRVPERSPYEEPARRIVAGIFRGVRLPTPLVLAYHIVPGHGEVYELHMVTRDGVVTAVVFESVAGGAFEPLTRMRYEDDPSAFDATVLALVREHAPEVYSRIDPATFALTGPLDLLTGAIVPTARRGHAPLPGGRFAVAIGDAHVSFDPITGQGSNCASRSAWLLGDLVVAQLSAGGRFDEAFCTEASARIWASVRASAEWTNAFLQPPEPHVLGVLVAAAQNRTVADAFASNFDHSDRQWKVLSSPEAAAGFIASGGVVSA
jgi:Styrene monooxygenase A putative substrate binding domain